jgi:hypothetical protein
MVLQVVTPCSLIADRNISEEHAASMLRAAHSSETLVPTYKTTGCNNPDFLSLLLTGKLYYDNMILNQITTLAHGK